MKYFKPPANGPKALLVDIETAPIIGHLWDIWEQTIGLNMIKSDWHILSWSAKWLSSPANEIMYMDQRRANPIDDDKECLQGIWNLMDEADIIISQNGKSFDTKKLNARFILQGFQPPSSYKQIDTKLVAKRHFAFTSNKLEYMTDKLCKKYKKLKHKEFQGFDMWKECLAGNPKAWKAMEIYNKYDVLSLEELYSKLSPWDSTIDFNLYRDAEENTCRCGSKDYKRNGYFYTSAAKYQRFKCTKCGHETRSRKNLFSKEKKAALKSGTTR